MFSNILPSEVELFDRIATEWIDDYHYWKLCYDYCTDQTCLTEENNQKLINSVLLMMSTPSKLKTFEILALILYQIETDTFGESFQLMYHMLSSLVEFSLPSLNMFQFRDLKHYAMKFTLEHPPLILGNIKKANDEKLEVLKKVSEMLLDEGEVKNVMNSITIRQKLTNFEEIKPKYYSGLSEDVNEDSLSSTIINDLHYEHLSNELENTVILKRNPIVVLTDIRKQNKKRVINVSSEADSSFSITNINFKEPKAPKSLDKFTNKAANTKKNKTMQLYNTSNKDLVKFAPTKSPNKPKELPARKRLFEEPTKIPSSRVLPRKKAASAVKTRKRMPWTLEEEEALVMGIEQHGKANWKLVKLNGALKDRTVRDCSDKWRNILKYSHLANIKARINLNVKNILESVVASAP